MASVALLRAVRRRDVASASFSAPCKSLTGNGKSSWPGSYLGQNWARLCRPFSSKPAGNNVVGGMTCVPNIQEIAAEVSKNNPSKGVNPDEAIALGAAIQGRDVKELIPLNVTLSSLGVETLGGIFTPLINRNTDIPTKKSLVFSTAAYNQTEVGIKVLEGDCEMASDNKTLAEFVLMGIPPAPPGMLEIEVTFDIDAYGIVTVSAKDKASGKGQQITIRSSGGLSVDEIEKNVKKAEMHPRKDKERKAYTTVYSMEESLGDYWDALINIRNKADKTIYSVEKCLGDYRDKIPTEVAREIEDSIADLRKTMGGDLDFVSEIKAKVDAADRAWSKIGQHVWRFGWWEFWLWRVSRWLAGKPEYDEVKK